MTSLRRRVLVVAALQAAALAPLAPLGDRLALAAALPRSRERPFRYGTVRGAGSAAFILGTLLSGRAVSGFGIGAMVWLNAALLALAALAGAKAPLLEGKRGLIVGIANESSIAWGCAKAFYALGAELAVTYLNDKAKRFVEPLAREAEAALFMPLDVQAPGQMEAAWCG
jgi:MFS family permease